MNNIELLQTVELVAQWAKRVPNKHGSIYFDEDKEMALHRLELIREAIEKIKSIPMDPSGNIFDLFGDWK